VALGHRRIAITVPFGEINFGGIFLEAYRAALSRHGIPFDPELVFQGGLTGADANLLTDALLDNGAPPTAVILIFEAAAVGIYERLSERGLRPGHDLSIIGLRNELAVQHLRPRLTCFDLSLFDVGVALGEALLAQMPEHSRQGVAPTGMRVPMVLRPGESDGPVARSEAPDAKRRRRTIQRAPAATS
jgi:DNA-binding LacI/PurR family transcriptional regulator